MLQKKGERPDVLVMTATPIPRSLALTAYGDLELSVLDELPPGRTPIATEVLASTKRGDVYQRLRQELDAGAQAYVVFPLERAREDAREVLPKLGEPEYAGLRERVEPRARSRYEKFAGG